jgi:circadian clock protein KaiC
MVPNERVSTGVSGLDVVLRGGLFRGGTYLLCGAPGTGKTVLGNQFCFSRAALGQRALYVTLLAETHGRLTANLSTLRFFHPEWVGQQVHYVSGFGALKEGGLGGLLKLLGGEIRRLEAEVLVVDGITAAAEAAAPNLSLREFLHGLSAHTGLSGCTALLIEAGGEPRSGTHQAMVDGIVSLTNELVGLQAIRSLEVSKFRGDAQIVGKHPFDISSAGLLVYPRIEALYRELPRASTDPEDRCGFGIPSLDEMMEGGPIRHSSTLLLGSPGAGKTLLGMNFLAQGARAGEPGLYFGFAEAPQQLLRKSQQVGLPLDDLLGDRLFVEARAAVETVSDALAQQVFELCQRHQIRRLFIDGLESFAHETLDPSRTGRFLTALFGELRSLKVTSMVTQQTPSLLSPELHASLEGVEAIVDNILVLRFFEFHSALHRVVTVLKMRESASDPRLRELLISSEGVRVGAQFESAHAILTGTARPVRPATTRKKGVRR